MTGTEKRIAAIDKVGRRRALTDVESLELERLILQQAALDRRKRQAPA